MSGIVNGSLVKSHQQTIGKAIIVGASLSGLMTGIALASVGLKVTILKW